LQDKSALLQGIEETRPDVVIHLAAQSFVPRSFENPRETYEINFLGTLNLLEALRDGGFKGRLLYVGSGDQYGRVEEENLPIAESLALFPRNPYAVSKAAAEMLCYQWSQSGDMDVVMARPFNHIGPGQNENFALSGFARQIVEIKLGRRDPAILTGDLNVTRDFTHVEDVVRAYLLLLSRGQRGEVYNVCSALEFNLGQLLQQMLTIAGVEAEVRPDPARFRAAEQKRVLGSNEKLRRHTGWQAQIPMEISLQQILNDWETRLTS
jgi:GDP-4-dehydro-6-deoxy-D-mannose reductase